MPQFIITIIAVLKSVGQPLTSLSSSIECIFENYNESVFRHHKIEFLAYQFIFSLSFPTAIAIVCLLYYLVLLIFKKKHKFSVQYYIVPIFIYLFLMFFPTIFYRALSYLTCRQLAGQKYIIGDSQFECNSPTDGVASKQNLIVVLPILIFELFALVVFLLVISIFKRKKLLYTPVEISSFKYQMGYLYLGYKESKYYWEFIRIFQRILIMSTFLIFFDFNSQKGCIVALILLVYAAMAQKVNPYENIEVNRIELYSNTVQILTFLSGAILQSFTYIWIQYFLLITIAIFNLWLVIYLVIKMIPNAWNSVILLLLRVKCIRNLKCMEKINNNLKK